MAHLAKLGALTDELVTIITSFSPQVNIFVFVGSSSSLLQHSQNQGADQFSLILRGSILVEKLLSEHSGMVITIERINLIFRIDLKV